MLDMLDVVIGFVLVMLVMSMAVTMITHLIGSALLNMQGKALKIGISHLLSLLDRGIRPADAEKIADHLLRNPLVGKPKLVGEGNKLASVVHREELVKLVLDFAIPGDLEKINQGELGDEDKLRLKLRQSLAANGIPDPQQVLKQVRDAVVELEKSNPELSHSMRINIAILNFAGSDFLSKLNSWFDQTIDRVSEVFTARTRTVTFAVSILLALFVQLDCFDLINRLSVDDDLRSKLVQSAIARVEETEKAQATGTGAPAGADASAPGAGAQDAGDPGTDPAAANTTEPAPGADAAANATGAEPPAPAASPVPAVSASKPASTQQVIDELQKAGLGDLEQFGIIGFPRSTADWASRWRAMTSAPAAPAPKAPPSAAQGGPVGNVSAAAAPIAANEEIDGYRVFVHLLGIFLTAALLSLGAPWWYSVLRDLVKLRSVVARNDDEQRAERQSTQAPPATAAATGAGPAAVPPQYRGGEAGDLTATG
jgi:hypothetical protein